jgi:hypothetical protein
MAALGKADFFVGSEPKTASTGKYAGKTRTEIVLEKIKNKDPFIVGKTASGSKVYGTSLDTKSFPFLLSYVENKSDKEPVGAYKVTQLFKDPDFGGGAGSGGGAEDTKFTESGQCYYTSLVFNIIKKPLTRKVCTPANLAKAAKFVDATIDLKTFLDKGPVDWFEKDIYLRTANLIYKDYKSKLKSPVYCHRGSGFMNSIYRAKKDVAKLDQFSAPGSFSDDKWNPGDIWLSSLPMNAKPLNESQNWHELNQKVLDFAGELKRNNQTSLLGVSLKKLGDTGGKVEKYNLAKRKHNESVKFKEFTFGKNGDFFSSIDVYIRFDVAEVQLRAFNSTSAWQGEIKGLSAAGGKIGGGNLNYYLEKHARKSIGYPRENRPRGRSWSETPASKVDLKKMYDLYITMMKLQSVKKLPVVSRPEFIKRAKAKGASFIFSKNMCLMFLSSFISSSPQVRNNISTEIVRYAASNTDVSSFFVKVF